MILSSEKVRVSYIFLLKLEQNQEIHLYIIVDNEKYSVIYVPFYCPISLLHVIVTHKLLQKRQ